MFNPPVIAPTTRVTHEFNFPLVCGENYGKRTAGLEPATLGLGSQRFHRSPHTLAVFGHGYQPRAAWPRFAIRICAHLGQ